MTFREKVYRQCLLLVTERSGRLQALLDELRESIKNETKSTVGDKHETARAHLQIEQEQTGRQLQELLDQKAILDKIAMSVHTIGITQGSLVLTNRGYFFISVAAGKIVVDDVTVFTLSALSPLGSRLMGLGEGDRVTVNGTLYVIEKVNE